MIVKIISRYNGVKSLVSLKKQHTVIKDDLKKIMEKYPNGINLNGYSQGKSDLGLFLYFKLGIRAKKKNFVTKNYLVPIY